MASYVRCPIDKDPGIAFNHNHVLTLLLLLTVDICEHAVAIKAILVHAYILAYSLLFGQEGCAEFVIPSGITVQHLTGDFILSFFLVAYFVITLHKVLRIYVLIVEDSSLPPLSFSLKPFLLADERMVFPFFHLSIFLERGGKS